MLYYQLRPSAQAINLFSQLLFTMQKLKGNSMFLDQGFPFQPATGNFCHLWRAEPPVTKWSLEVKFTAMVLKWVLCSRQIVSACKRAFNSCFIWKGEPWVTVSFGFQGYLGAHNFLDGNWFWLLIKTDPSQLIIWMFGTKNWPRNKTLFSIFASQIQSMEA